MKIATSRSPLLTRSQSVVAILLQAPQKSGTREVAAPSPTYDQATLTRIESALSPFIDKLYAQALAAKSAAVLGVFDTTELNKIIASFCALWPNIHSGKVSRPLKENILPMMQDLARGGRSGTTLQGMRDRLGQFEEYVKKTLDDVFPAFDNKQAKQAIQDQKVVRNNAKIGSISPDTQNKLKKATAIHGYGNASLHIHIARRFTPRQLTELREEGFDIQERNVGVRNAGLYTIMLPCFVAKDTIDITEHNVARVMNSVAPNSRYISDELPPKRVTVGGEDMRVWLALSPRMQNQIYRYAGSALNPRPQEWSLA